MPVLQFKGKTAVECYHHTVPHHTLEFDGTLSVLGNEDKPGLDGNLIIEGDNLLALKALLPTHAGRIKCIYIDPPYNTGDEGWVYNDNLTQPQFKEWIGETVGKEGEDATRHDKWCCMMYPRLQLVKEMLRDIVRRVTERLYQANPGLPGRLGLVKFLVRDKLVGLVERETDRQTQEAFETLFRNKRLCFYLECMEGRFEIPHKVPIRVTRRLVHDNNEPVQRSLFDYVADDLNEYEKSVALYLDNRPEVLWWYRNLVGPQHFSIQGYKRGKGYPDFVVQQGRDKKPLASVVVVESKGKHLKGNEDTTYKRSVAEYFGKIGSKVSWQKLGEDFQDQTFRFYVLDEGEYEDRDWRDDLKKLLEQV
jgi:hypothetical protein